MQLEGGGCSDAGAGAGADTGADAGACNTSRRCVCAAIKASSAALRCARWKSSTERAASEEQPAPPHARSASAISRR